MSRRCVDAETHADRLPGPLWITDPEDGGAHLGEPLEVFQVGRNRRGRTVAYLLEKVVSVRITPAVIPTNSVAAETEDRDSTALLSTQS